MKTSKTYRRKELAATISLLLAAYPTVYAQEQADGKQAQAPNARGEIATGNAPEGREREVQATLSTT